MHLGVAALGSLGLISWRGARSFSSKPTWVSTLLAQVDVEITDQNWSAMQSQLTRPCSLVLQNNGISVSLLHAVADGLLKTVQYFWSPSVLNWAEAEFFLSYNSVRLLVSICVVLCAYGDEAWMLHAGDEKSNEINEYGTCCSDTAWESSFNVYNMSEHCKEMCMDVLPFIFL